MSQLIDAYGRQVKYVRLSVTDRCDMRCSYCIPKGYKGFSAPESWLTDAEIVKMIRAFAELGVNRLRITGGEPLTRPGIDALIIALAALPGLDDLSLSTNAVRLKKYAQAIKTAGVSRINVSLDSLQEKRFNSITNGKLSKVIDGLMEAKQVGFSSIKINMVVMRGINDDEVIDMVNFCREHDFILRFIETMPLGETGLKATQSYISLQEIQARLEQQFSLSPSIVYGGGPARYFKIAGSKHNIGFISPISQHFCETCNRVRLTMEGDLYMCLGQEHKVEFRALLRANISNTDLQEAIVKAIDLKPKQHHFNDNVTVPVRFMSKTGG